MFTKATGINKKLKVLVYGQSGSGKTHLALTFPRPAVIDCEGGTELFGGRFDFDVLRTKDLDEVLKAMENINPAQYDTVVVDPVTVLWQVMMEAGQVAAERRALKQKRNPDEATLTPRDWGIIKRKVNALYTRLVNLPCHVVVCGRIKDVNETRGTEVVKVGERVDAEKSTEYLFDIIIKLEIGRDGKRIGIVEKDRSGKLQGKRIPDPSFATFSEIVTATAANKVTAVAQDQNAIAEKLSVEFNDAQLDADIARAGEVVAQGATVNEAIAAVDYVKPETAAALDSAVKRATQKASKIERPAPAETVCGWLRDSAWGKGTLARVEYNPEENWRCTQQAAQQVAALFGKALTWDGASEADLRKARLLTYQYVFGEAVQSSHDMSHREAAAVIRWMGGGYEPQEPAMSEARFLYHAAQVEAGQKVMDLPEGAF